MLNYHAQLEKIIEEHAKRGERPKLLLHCCCAPCASYCLEFLSGKFDITCFFYNPNITEKEEYDHRLQELKSYLKRAKCEVLEVIDGGFDGGEFYRIASGLEQAPEGGARCYLCYKLRLDKTAEVAENGGYDYFATTLTVSPHKNAAWLNALGFEAADGRAVKYLPSDFKKKGGYKRSVELSVSYGLYRQNFCGCEFSRAAAKDREEKK